MTTPESSDLDGMTSAEWSKMKADGIADAFSTDDFFIPDASDPNIPPFAGNLMDPRYNQGALIDIIRRVPRSGSQLADLADSASVRSGLVGLAPRNPKDFENRFTETIADLVEVKSVENDFYFISGPKGIETLPGGPPEPDYYFIRPHEQLEPQAEFDQSTLSEVPVPGEDHHTGMPNGFDVNVIRQDFPILNQTVNGQKLAWFDNAATTQKPRLVIQELSRYYENDNSNIHRGAHKLAARATDAYERSREKVQRFLGAADASEIVFVRGTTEAINLVAYSYGERFIETGDEILLTTLEHHSNILPWQELAHRKGAFLKVAPINERGEIMMKEYARLLGQRTKMVAMTHVSNALGTLVPVQQMTEMAHSYGACVLIDGAQAVPHLPVNVQEIGADYYALSGHKVFGPTGIGALYGRKELLEAMPPWQVGGGMIDTVTFEESTYAPPPAKFEAGTGSIADAVGLGSALDYVTSIGRHNIEHYERGLTSYLMEQLAQCRQVRLVGTALDKVSVVSFVIPGKRSEDIGRYLDQWGIAVRAGHHCAQPAMRRYGLDSTVRASLAFYNTYEEIDRLIDAIRHIIH